MIVVVGTNALVQMMGRASPFAELKSALEQGRISWAVSTSILMEYEEVIRRHAGADAWVIVARMIEIIAQLRQSIIFTSPTFRFRNITGDPDDDAFADCAIVANAEWIITEDRHFDVMRGAGYKPQPITPEAFIRQQLGSS